MLSYYGSGRFCSRFCSNSHIQTDEQNLKRSRSAKNKAISYINDSSLNRSENDINCIKQKLIKKFKLKIEKIIAIKLKKITENNKTTKNSNITKSNKTIKEIYNYQCGFRFNLNDYPSEFNFKLLKDYGMYSASNHGNNINGVARDHLYSKYEGFVNKIDPYIISHPANCCIVLQKDNMKKSIHSKISLEDLINNINN